MASLVRPCANHLFASIGRRHSFSSSFVLRTISSSLTAKHSFAQSSTSSSISFSSSFVPSSSQTNPLKACLFRSPFFAPRSPFSRHHLYLTIGGNRHLNTMAPINQSSSASARIEQLITENPVMIFSKSTCPYCTQVKELFNNLKVGYHSIEWDKVQGGQEIRQAVIDKVGRTSVPQVFIRGQHVGGCDDTLAANENGKLAELLQGIPQYDFDLVVVGGGSGGLAASKEAAKLGKRVALLDFVKPTPHGVTWGLGGTCVNVGCIPKKLMHQAALVGQTIRHSTKFGWETNNDARPVVEVAKHNWETMVESVQANIKSSNFKYRVAVRGEKVTYLNAYGTFVDNHTIKLVDKKGKESAITSKHFLIATGERPKYPADCEGAVEYGITSDDLFSLPHSPGKTVVVGASYVALECAGFLRGFGLDVSVMVRSILLRGFDQEMAEKIGEFMAEEGIKFLRPCVPFKVELIEKGAAGQLDRLRVHGRLSNGEVVTEECNTVLFAVGRKPCTDTIGLEKAGVQVAKNGKIPVTYEQTNIPNIYAVGDILEGKPELTPVAIEAGLRLVRRLYGNKTQQCDYTNVATTVFTPLEYGCVGLTEEDAIKQYGEDNVEVYIQYLTPFEWTIAHHLDNKCYAKLITVLNENERIVGFHFLGPNAGEVIQLASLAVKKNATKDELDAVIGIHPTCAEVFTNLTVTKRSGQSAIPQGCCG